MSWITKFPTEKITHKGKKTKIIVGQRDFDAYYKVAGMTGDNKLVQLPPGYEGRLDMISTMVYGTPNLWWVIAMANDIMDPEEELIPGALIKVPTIV
tara:strand:- start:303 stop:593 length:291 start_codon:yes stop_codon:yes gene_type:complete